ncbi:MAG: T9SS type A sorting domain-containing protein [Bacteroidetes bacterium]|nr:T9SS type A sorting domain-containing protein [Bacteroidota bacterium]
MRKLILILTLIVSQTKAQSISSSLLCSGGDMFKFTGIQIEWTLGDLATGSYGTITEGFLQGSSTHRSGVDEIARVSSINGLSAYPNPFNEGIQLQVSNHTGSFKVEVFDVLGKLVHTSNNFENGTFMNLSHLQSGVYFATAIANDKNLGTIKLNKL